MRITSIIGLTKEACMFLSENCNMIVAEKCPHCHKAIRFEYDKRVYGDAKNAGMFDDGPELYEYTLKNGSKVREVVQAVPWSSGPCIFLCLEKQNVTRIGEWSQEEIDQA